ncbi:hypothetical protein [Candidatus Leptofilum sp.]|uniref:hypothetical protein n=1 Tax=Candidatus Leptofilum sp. TaxID=3241576 RepID=UPI003B597241
MTNPAIQTTGKTKHKLFVVVGTLFCALLGGILVALILGLAAFFALFDFPLITVIVYQIYIPATIAGVLGGSYIFLREEPIPRTKLRASYKKIISGITITYCLLFAVEFVSRSIVRQQHQAFADALSQNNYQTAYEFMSESYQANHSYSEFISDSLKFLNGMEISDETLNLFWDVNVIPLERKAQVHYQSRRGSTNTYIWERSSNKWRFSGQIDFSFQEFD